MALFWPALEFGFAPMDDAHLILQNPALHGWTFESFKHIFASFDPELYIPITLLSFKVESIVGLHPWLLHFNNIILHILNAVLVSVIVAKLFSSRLTGICAGILFAVHPLTVETVVWISSRKDLLATFFALLSILCASHLSKPSQMRIIVLMTTCFVLAALSKISVVFLPLLLFVVMRKKISTHATISILTPASFLAVALGIVAIIGKENAVQATGIIERLLLAGYAISSSIGRFVSPISLSPYYALPRQNSVTLIATISPMILMTFAWILRKKIPLFGLGIVWFFLFIIPTTLNIQTDVRASGLTFASDRYMYLPMIGLIIALIAVFKDGMRRLAPTFTSRALMGITTVISCIFLPLTHAQVLRWQDADSLYSHALHVSPQSVEARIAVARSIKESGNIAGAFDVLREGLVFSDDPRLHLEAGNLYAAAGQVAEAEAEFQTVNQRAPELVEALYGIAQLRIYEKNLPAAKKILQEAVEREPRYVRARIDVAKILILEGKLQDAKTQLLEAQRLDPMNVEIRHALKSLK